MTNFKPQRNGETGAAIIIMMVFILLMIVFISTAAYRESTVNKGAARLAAFRNDAVNQNNEVGAKMIYDIAEQIFASMSSGNNDADRGKGNIDIAATAQTCSQMHIDTYERLSQTGTATSEKIIADWFSDSGLRATGSSINGPFDFLQSSLTKWGAGPTGDAGSADQWLYPRSLFGLHVPGETFVARRFQWTASVSMTDTRDPLVTAAGRSVNRDVTQPRRYTLFEVPFQVSILADKIINLGQEAGGAATGNRLAVQGTVYGRQVHLLGNVAVGGNTASAQGVNSAGGSIRGQAITIPSPWGTEIYAPGGILAGRQISATSQSRNAAFFTIASGPRYYSEAATLPTHWDLYTLPFYRCTVRIEIHSTTPTAPGATIRIFNPISVTGMTVATNGWTFHPGNWNTQNFLTAGVTANGTDDRPLYTVDPKALAGWLSNRTGQPPGTFNRVYIGQTPSNLPSPSTPGDVAVSLANTQRMSDFFGDGYALVTRQRFYYSSNFNTEAPSGGCTVIAPDIRYGIAGNTNQRVNFAGQIGVISGDVASSTSNPTDFRRGAGQSVALSQKQVTLTQINNPTTLPPITLRNWLIISEGL